MTKFREIWTPERRKLLLVLILTVYSGASICWLLNFVNFANQADGYGFTQSALSLLAFAVPGSLLWRLAELAESDGSDAKRPLCYAMVFGFLLGLSFVMGYQLRMAGLTYPGLTGKLKILIYAGGLDVSLLPALYRWFRMLGQSGGRARSIRARGGSLRREANEPKTWQSFLIFWGILFLCWFPVFLAYYPAIMSYDFNRQSEEAIKGTIWFWEHHPLIHTWLIRAFLLLGEHLGSYEAGMAIFSILQMLTLSAAIAYSCALVRRLSGRRWTAVLALAWFGLLPLHPVLALSVTKDILFSAFSLLLVILLWEMDRRYEDSGERIPVWMRGAFVLLGVLNILFRNNAVYALAVFAVLYVIRERGLRRKGIALLLCAAAIAGGIGARKALLVGLDAIPSPGTVEMISVPIMQMARVGNRRAADLSDEDWELLNSHLSEEMWDDYYPPISDGIKIAANKFGVLTFGSAAETFGEWLKLGLHYPDEYLDAFLELTAGYWFLDDFTHAENLGYGDDSGLGLLYTFNASSDEIADGAGIASIPVLPGLHRLYNHIVSGNGYYAWPALSNLMKPAFYDWAFFLLLFSALYLRARRTWLAAAYPFLYFLTLLLGPVVNVRYMYYLIVLLPFLYAVLFAERET